MPAKPLDQIVQEHFGSLQFALCQVRAENEALKADNDALKARIKELETKVPSEPMGSVN